jgi:hypothetical protein
LILVGTRRRRAIGGRSRACPGRNGRPDHQRQGEEGSEECFECGHGEQKRFYMDGLQPRKFDMAR